MGTREEKKGVGRIGIGKRRLKRELSLSYWEEWAPDLRCAGMGLKVGWNGCVRASREKYVVEAALEVIG